jgi:transketolase C-terminal domain/subunit
VTLRFVPQAELARLRAPECLVRGRGTELREGADGLIVTTGPRCGANEEVLRAHGLDADGIAERVAASVGVPA